MSEVSSTLAAILAAQISDYLIGGHSHMTAQGQSAIAALIGRALANDAEAGRLVEAADAQFNAVYHP